MEIHFRTECPVLFSSVQTDICLGLEKIDGGAQFSSEHWERPESGASYGGGGLTRILRNGKVFEQAGVNFSAVEGTLPPDMSERLIGVRAEQRFFATGVSLVIHPHSPLVPTTHANYRYLEVADKKWFGGGCDLTPYYLVDEDAKHFHHTTKTICDRFDTKWYPDFKKQCDEYFYLPHRGETRGVGGIFFDYLGKDQPNEIAGYLPLVTALAKGFLDTYVPIVEKRKSLPWTEAQKQFQLIRRGRYVEFNLLYDRGTLFGLKTGGRTESILMSLPPVVRWEYNFTPEEGSEEARLLSVLRAPRNWT